MSTLLSSKDSGRNSREGYGDVGVLSKMGPLYFLCRELLFMLACLACMWQVDESYAHLFKFYAKIILKKKKPKSRLGSKITPNQSSLFCP